MQIKKNFTNDYFLKQLQKSGLVKKNQIGLTSAKNLFGDMTDDKKMQAVEILLENDNIQKFFDLDGDGELSKEEKEEAFDMISSIDTDIEGASEQDFNLFQKYLSYFFDKYENEDDDVIVEKALDYLKKLDGNADDLSVDDFGKISELFETNPEFAEYAFGFDSEDEIPNVQDLDEQAKIEANKIDKQNTHASNYVGPTTTLKSEETTNNLQSIQEQINAKNKEIIAQNSLKAEAMKENEDYGKKISELNNITKDISTLETTIQTNESELHNVQYDLIAAQNELNNLKDPVIFDEYKDEINARRAELKTTVQTLQTKENELKNKIKEDKETLLEKQKSKDSLEGEIADIESKNPNNKIAEINANIKKLKSELSALEAQKTAQETSVNEQRKQELSDAEIYGKAQAQRQSEFVKFMLDYATNPSTKEKYDKWYFAEWNGHSYCAIFTSNVTELMYAKVMEKTGLTAADLKNMDGYNQLQKGIYGIKGNQMGMAASTWGNEIQPALDTLGINTKATIDITKLTPEERQNAVRNGLIYPGMTFEYKGADGSYHTGFIESINKDMSWTTIEGNTSVRYDDGAYERHTIGAHNVDVTKDNLANVTDSTMKVYIWLYQKGLMTIDEINARMYNN